MFVGGKKNKPQQWISISSNKIIPKKAKRDNKWETHNKTHLIAEFFLLRTSYLFTSWPLIFLSLISLVNSRVFSPFPLNTRKLCLPAKKPTVECHKCFSLRHTSYCLNISEPIAYNSSLVNKWVVAQNYSEILIVISNVYKSYMKSVI